MGSDESMIAIPELREKRYHPVVIGGFECYPRLPEQGESALRMCCLFNRKRFCSPRRVMFSQK